MAAVDAIFIGIKLLRGSEVSKQSLLRWNSYGLIDFLIAITVDTLLRSSLLGGTTSTDPLSSLPLRLRATLLIPFYIITHLIIILQSRMRCAPATIQPPVGADLVYDFFRHQNRKQYWSCKPTQRGLHHHASDYFPAIAHAMRSCNNRNSCRSGPCPRFFQTPEPQTIAVLQTDPDRSTSSRL